MPGEQEKDPRKCGSQVCARGVSYATVAHPAATASMKKAEIDFGLK
ncbi:hypothetical protein [Desulfotruncus alcoholivorax]|nr:hypothetical protein [Desulfotruncus alcoholivorax]